LLLRFTNVYNTHRALGARTAAPRIEKCRTGATMSTDCRPQYRGQTPTTLQ